MAEQLANNATGTLASGMLIGATSLTLNSGQGAAFPSTGNFRIIVSTGGVGELMLVGARSGDTLSSITRGIEGTAAAAHNSGDAVKLELTAGGLQQFIRDNSVQASPGISDGEFEVYRSSDTSWQRSSVKPANVSGLAPGTNGQYLTTSGGVTVWSSPPLVAPTHLPSVIPTAANSGVLVANQAYLVPIPNVVIATSIGTIVFRVVTASGNMDVGIYFSDDEITFTRLFSTGTFVVPAAGTQYKSISSQTITPVTGRRWYYALAADNATASFIGALGTTNNTVTFGTYVKTTSFVLPSSISSPTRGDGALVPQINGTI